MPTRFSSLYLDTGDNSSSPIPRRASIDRLVMNLADPRHRHSPFAAFSSRLRSGLAAIMEPRLIDSMGRGGSVHPLLTRPPADHVHSDVVEQARDLISALRSDRSEEPNRERERDPREIIGAALREIGEAMEGGDEIVRVARRLEGESGEGVRVLQEADLVRGVRGGGAVEWGGRGGRPYERVGPASREREKELPSGIVKRWTYDPPSCGGDVLPGVFDSEGGRRRAKGGGAPTILQETHEEVVQVGANVVARLEGMLNDVGLVEAKVTELEMKEEKRKEQEEKRKKKKRKKTEEVEAHADGGEQEVVERDETEEGRTERMEEAREVEEQQEEETEEAVAERAVERAAEAAENAEDEADGDAMDTEEDGRETHEDGNGGGEVQTEGESGDQVEPRTEGENENASQNPFSAVATERAAAAGISLDAPANENPEVVAAATASTGIDPAFIAALPEDMRMEILTQYYERIHTNGSSQGGAAGSSQTATTVNQDFLVALPPALRAEVLEMEAEFQARQQNQNGNSGAGGGNGNGGNSGGGGGGNAQADEMDNATFLATLAPELREEILLTSGDAFLESLPPNIAAEARVLREREASSRMPWRMQPDFSVGMDRRMPNRLRDMRHGGRNQARSHQPKEAPSYRWKKVGNGWLRECPNVDDEPTTVLKENGLSSMMQLLWLRKNLGVNCLDQVLGHACKSTPSRKLVLEQLLTLITTEASLDSRAQRAISKKPRNEKDSSRPHGTAVSRAIDVLIQLSKTDVVVAEALLGLPKNEDELKQIPEEISENMLVTQKYPLVSFSTLVGLLNSPLFKRSTLHLERLVSLINTLCHSLPPTMNDGSNRRGNTAYQMRRRRIISRGMLHSDMGDPMNILMEEDDPAALFQVAEEDDDEDSVEDDFDHMEPISGSDREYPTPPPPPESRGANRSKDSEKKKNIPIPPQYRIPGFKSEDLEALTQVLLRQGCNERTYDRVGRSIGVLGELYPLRSAFANSLVNMAVQAGEDVYKEYFAVVTDLESAALSKDEKQKSAALSPFSISSSGSELMLLRIVKSLAALWSHDADEKAEEGEKAEESEKEKEGSSSTLVKKDSNVISTEQRFRPMVYSGLRLLWNALDRLLELVSEEEGMKKATKPPEQGRRPSSSGAGSIDRIRSGKRSLPPILARLSPMIEAFLVTHAGDDSQVAESEPASPRSPAPSSHGGLSPLLSPSIKSKGMDNESTTSRGMDEHLLKFVEKHRGPINAILRANPPLLETSFKGALKHPDAIDFDNKKAYFRNVIRKRSSEIHAGSIRINVRRERVFDDSYQQLRLRTAEEMKGRLHVQFTGEEGVDAGGVTREWYVILARQIFDPNYVLFTRSAAKAATYQPDKRSYINTEHLEFFKFVGRVIGKAIYDGQLLDAYFTRSFYKHILGLRPNYHDIEAQDPEYYKSLKWMLENDITGILDYTMSSEYDEFGQQTVIDLVPNGRNIAVTEENKADYVKLVTEVRMTKAIEKQIQHFKDGFYEMIPQKDVKIFNALELELLMSGLPDIDVADLKANVEYTGYTSSSPQINWFWRCVGKMNQEDLARLVMFVTGTSKVPLEGFSDLQGMNGMQKFHIHRVTGNSLRLPSAHTCFNQLDLPEYSSAEILSERLLRAVRECSVGFGFA